MKEQLGILDLAGEEGILQAGQYHREKYHAIS